MLILDALAHLVDPSSGTALGVRNVESAGDDVLEGELVLQKGPSDRSYPVRQGIASFFGLEAASQTVRSFDQKWARHRYYREHTGRFYTKWFLDRYGFFESECLREFLSGAVNILDAGTGSGRDAVNF